MLIAEASIGLRYSVLFSGARAPLNVALQQALHSRLCLRSNSLAAQGVALLFADANKSERSEPSRVKGRSP